MKVYDLICLGGGSGGIAAANRAAQYGAKVLVIEGKQLGGTCVNLGCVPKKISWYAAHISQAANHYGPGSGFKFKQEEFNYSKFIEARDSYVERSRNSYIRTFEKNQVDYVSGYGKFVNNHIISVNGKEYFGKYIIIATGGRAYVPNVEGKELLDTSDSFFAWQELPKSVALVGAGYIAVELAGLLNSLGVETHLMVRYDKPLRKFDSLLSDSLIEHMKNAGIYLHSNTTINRYVRTASGQIACYEDETNKVEVDRVVMAVGRHPNTDNLGLERTSIVIEDNGAIKVDDNHQTNSEGVYALGDVISKIDLTPVAIRAGRRIAEYLFNHAENSAIDYENVPTVLFTHPAIGTIGLTEEQAVERYGQENLKIYQTQFNSMYASAAGLHELTHMKLICQGADEKVIGLHAIGEGVDEMIQGFGVAIKMGATKSDFDSVIAIHPTGSEEFVTMR